AIVQAALALFHDGGFRYTLAPAPLGRDAMDDFLFDTREGFCEHYSSAFTVLMRAAGIPARVVTGYQGGYWNALGGYLLVRNSDAHAWSEVWLAGHGWVRVDPTAAVRPQRISMGAAAAPGQLPWYQSGWLQSMRNRWDIVNRWWNLGVNGFDALRQRGLLKPFGIRDTDPSTLALLLAWRGCGGGANRKTLRAPRCANWNASWRGRAWHDWPAKDRGTTCNAPPACCRRNTTG